MANLKRQISRDNPSESGIKMWPRENKKTHEQPPIRTSRLDQMLNMDQVLVPLAESFNWASLAEFFGPLYSEKAGRPGIPIRTKARLVILQHAFGLSDEHLESGWPERPFWQFFCGEEFFNHDLPVDGSHLLWRRKRHGEAGVEHVLTLTIEAGVRTKTFTPNEMQVVVVDTTAQPKAMEFPTDTRLYLIGLHRQLRVAEATDTTLQLGHRDLAKSAYSMHGPYTKAKQYKRAVKGQKMLKVYAGRVKRDLELKNSHEAWENYKGALILASLVLTQETKTKGKVYSMNAQEVECITKGKAHKHYEFSVKTSLATTAWCGFARGVKSASGNPYDGYTVVGQPGKVVKLMGMLQKKCHKDNGHKGHGVDHENCRVILAGSRKGISTTIKKEMKRRSSIEEEIGHQKADGKLGRNWLKGVTGDAKYAVLGNAGHNMRKILAHLRRLYALIGAWLTAALNQLPLIPGALGSIA